MLITLKKVKEGYRYHNFDLDKPDYTLQYEIVLSNLHVKYNSFMRRKKLD